MATDQNRSSPSLLNPSAFANRSMMLGLAGFGVGRGRGSGVSMPSMSVCPSWASPVNSSRAVAGSSSGRKWSSEDKSSTTFSNFSGYVDCSCSAVCPASATSAGSTGTGMAAESLKFSSRYSRMS
jgi:hypothetical protein